MNKLIGKVVHFGKRRSSKKFDTSLRIPTGPHYTAPEKPVGNLYKARPWQTRALQKLSPRLAGKVNPFTILIAPTGSGKSLVQKALAHDCALRGDRVLIVVPESIIIKQFGTDLNRYSLNVAGMYATLAWKVTGGNLLDASSCKTTCEGDAIRNDDGIISRLKRFITSPVPSAVEDRVLVCTHASLVAAFKQIPKSEWKNVTLFIDEAHHSKYIEEEDLTKAEIQERRDINGALANIIRHYLKTPTAGRLMLTTATWLRGDSQTIVPEENLHRFEVFELEMHEHIAYNMPKGDIAFKFSLAKNGDYAEFLREEFLRDPSLNTITYLPPVNSKGWSPEKKLALLEEYQRVMGKSKEVIRKDPTGEFVYGRMHSLKQDTKVLSVEFVTLAGRSQRENEFFKCINEPQHEDKQVLNLLVQNKGREAFDCPKLARSLVLKPRSSLPMVIQMLGRLLRAYSVGCKKHGDAPEETCKHCFFKRHVEFNIVLPENMLADKDQFEDYTGTVFMVMALGWLFRTKLPKKLRTQEKMLELAKDLREKTFTGSDDDGKKSAEEEAREALQRVFGEDSEEFEPDVVSTLVDCMKGALWSLADAAKDRLGDKKFLEVCQAIDANPYEGAQSVYVALVGEKLFQTIREAYIGAPEITPEYTAQTMFLHRCLFFKNESQYVNPRTLRGAVELFGSKEALDKACTAEGL